MHLCRQVEEVQRQSAAYSSQLMAELERQRAENEALKRREAEARTLLLKAKMKEQVSGMLHGACMQGVPASAMSDLLIVVCFESDWY